MGIYYDSGQKELTNVVNSVFNAHLSTVAVSTPKDSAERALTKGYFKTMDAKRFGS